MEQGQQVDEVDAKSERRYGREIVSRSSKRSGLTRCTERVEMAGLPADWAYSLHGES